MVARQHCAQAVYRRPVAHQHMAAGGDFQRAGAGPLEGTVENVTARRHPRHIQRIAVQEQIAGRGSRGHARGKVVSVGRRHVQLRAVIGAGGHDVALGPAMIASVSPLRNPTISPSRAYRRVTWPDPAALAVGASK
ncbi:hypothetical protein G6F63_014723 [Rhizopus arrhizus]|nr:hypothetical protein G6F63_014723 [Rhizopus arrhizus]